MNPIYVADAGACGDGVTDDRTAIQTAINAAISGGGTVIFSAGRYKISKYLLVLNATGVRFQGEPGAVILYPSDVTTVGADSIATNTNQSRSAFFVKNSAEVVFEGLSFEGGQTANFTINAGAAVYATSSSDVCLIRCHNLYGNSLLRQDVTALDVRARVLHCTTYGQRGYLSVGLDAVVAHSHFELPTTTDFDRTAANESTHGIYLYAGRENTKVLHNTFRNIRETGVKVSGSSAPLRHIWIEGNTFDDCGAAIEAGGDGANQEHTDLQITGNIFKNCGTNRQYWNLGHSVWILGARSVLIRGNQFWHDRDCIYNISATRDIKIAQYTGTSQPVEDVQIVGNQFRAHMEAGGVTSPGLCLSTAIEVGSVGLDATFRGSCIIADNQLYSSASVGLSLSLNVGLIVSKNVFNNIPTAIIAAGNRLPVYQDNLLIGGTSTSTNAQLRMTRDSFPRVRGNRSHGRFGANPTSFSLSAGGSTAEDHPLLGTRGRAVCSEARPEVVFAYGDGWTNGDTVTVSGVTFTYQSAITDALTQFNSAATLIALIDAHATYTCVDYGAPFSVVTNHLRVRRAVASATVNAFSVATVCANPTAGVLLETSAGICQSRGEGTTNTATVLWSPDATLSTVAGLEAADDPALAVLLASGSRRLAATNGVDLVMQHGDASLGETFRWWLES
jgi:hypothetical protein